MDPQLKCFVDEQHIEIPPEWGLPTPNSAASYKSMSKYGKDLLPMSEKMVEAMNQAWNYTQRHFGLYMGNSRVLDLQEAVSHLDMSTSSGAPFNQHFKTKKELFEKDPGIMEWLERDWERLAVDPNWTCLATNSLKEELRTAEKIVDNSIRTFMSLGVDGTVHGTRLFVDMNEKMYAAHLKTASAVGMSPYKGAWNRLYSKLKAFRLGYALDESQYDSSLRTYLMWGCARMRWFMLAEQYQTPENLRRLLVYYRNLINTLVIGPDGVIVMKKTGNPSGSVNTITDNTLILYTLLAYAWIMTSPEDTRSYEQFELHTAKALVGDDNTWTVSDEAHSFYNARTIIAEWKLLGVTTTTDSLEPRRPSELDFLSAHTVFMGGVAVPVYSRVKLMNSLLYAPKEHLTPAVTLERTAALLSVGWTDLPFRSFCRSVIAWLLEKYDAILYEDPRWILAKAQIQTDEVYYRLFTGEQLLLRPQCLSGGTVKLTQPDKSIMSGANPKRNGTKPGKKTRSQRRKAAQKRQNRRGVVVSTQRPRKRVTRVRGVGGYFGDAGSSLGSSLGGKAGRYLGGMADTVFGLGAYNVRRNSLLADGSLQTPPSGPPRVVNTAKGEATVFHHREYVGDITSGPFAAGSTTSTAFDMQVYHLNPGNSSLFPWLSGQAQGFQEYEMHGQLFQLITETADFSANFAIGNMMMAADYNPVCVDPASKVELLELEYSASVKTSHDLIMPIECDRANNGQNHLWIALDNDYLGTDARSFDLAKVYVATQGQPNEFTKVAELWNTYEVWFYKPKLPESSVTGSGFHMQISGVTSFDPFGTTQTIMPGSNPHFTYDDPTAAISFPEGQNRWFVYLDWSSLAGVYAEVVPVLAGLTAQQLFSSVTGNNTSVSSTAGNTAASARMIQTYIVTSSGPVGTFSLVGGTFPAGAVYGDVYITQLPDNLIT
jgi:hypothetical protein